MIRLVLFFSIIATASSLHPGPNTVRATSSVSDTANPHNPALQSFWGSNATGSTMTPDMARAMLDSPLVVRGTAGSSYTITRFQFSYKELTQYKDDSTGEMKTTYHLYTRDYYNTASIDSTWKSNIDSTLQSGETIYVNHIIVKDAQGKKTMAPSLELSIQ